jgi:hypothetical protein
MISDLEHFSIGIGYVDIRDVGGRDEADADWRDEMADIAREEGSERAGRARRVSGEWVPGFVG